MLKIKQFLDKFRNELEPNKSQNEIWQIDDLDKRRFRSIDSYFQEVESNLHQEWENKPFYFRYNHFFNSLTYLISEIKPELHKHFNEKDIEKFILQLVEDNLSHPEDIAKYQSEIYKKVKDHFQELNSENEIDFISFSAFKIQNIFFLNESAKKEFALMIEESEVPERYYQLITKHLSRFKNSLEYFLETQAETLKYFPPIKTQLIKYKSLVDSWSSDFLIALNSKFYENRKKVDVEFTEEDSIIFQSKKTKQWFLRTLHYLNVIADDYKTVKKGFNSACNAIYENENYEENVFRFRPTKKDYIKYLNDKFQDPEKDKVIKNDTRLSEYDSKKSTKINEFFNELITQV